MPAEYPSGSREVNGKEAPSPGRRPARTAAGQPAPYAIALLRNTIEKPNLKAVSCHFGRSGEISPKTKTTVCPVKIEVSQKHR
jgi:hypothetical protein